MMILTRVYLAIDRATGKKVSVDVHLAGYLFHLADCLLQSLSHTLPKRAQLILEFWIGFDLS